MALKPSMNQSLKFPKNYLANTTILVTGAGQGIGKAAALAYAAHGATVILLGRTISKLEKTYDAILEAGGPEPYLYPLNLIGANPEDYQKLADKILSEFGCLHGLLNNAGIAGPRTPFEHYNIETWFRIMQANVNGPFMLTRALLPALRKAPRASIIFTVADFNHGEQEVAYWGAYSVSKFAVEGMMKTLAAEFLSSNVRINAINPIAVRTGLTQQALPGTGIHHLPAPEAIMSVYLELMGQKNTHHAEILNATE